MVPRDFKYLFFKNEFTPDIALILTQNCYFYILACYLTQTLLLKTLFQDVYLFISRPYIVFFFFFFLAMYCCFNLFPPFLRYYVDISTRYPIISL